MHIEHFARKRTRERDKKKQLILYVSTSINSYMHCEYHKFLIIFRWGEARPPSSIVIDHHLWCPYEYQRIGMRCTNTTKLLRIACRYNYQLYRWKEQSSDPLDGMVESCRVKDACARLIWFVPIDSFVFHTRHIERDRNTQWKADATATGYRETSHTRLSAINPS